jgi:putative flippase GtrA
MSARTPLAYVAVAGFCILLHNAVVIVGDAAGMPLWLSIVLSFVIVAAVGYFLHARLTFRQPLAVAGLVRYAFGMSANLPLAFVTTWFWSEQAGMPMSLAAPLASACMLAVNYLLARWAIVSPKAPLAGTR